LKEFFTGVREIYAIHGLMEKIKKRFYATETVPKRSGM